MSNWVKLSPADAAKYRIPYDIAIAPTALLLGKPPFPGDDPYKDDEWPFVALIPKPDDLYRIIFIVRTIPIQIFWSNRDWIPTNEKETGLLTLIVSQDEIIQLLKFIIPHCVKYKNLSSELDNEFTLSNEGEINHVLRIKAFPHLPMLVFTTNYQMPDVSIFLARRFGGTKLAFEISLLGFEKSKLDAPNFYPKSQYKSITLTYGNLLNILQTIISQFQIPY